MFNISDDFLPIYAKFFSRSTILEFIYKKEPKYINDTLRNSLHKSGGDLAKLRYRDVFDGVYKEICQRYRCEYVYKNAALFHEIISSDRHQGDAYFLTEVSVGKSKADVVVANGTTTVYEIKTELDNTSRLESQLDDYIKVFDKIYILTCQSKLKSIQEILAKKSEYSVVGVCLFNSKDNGNKITTEMEATSNIENISSEHVYDTINYSEFKKYYPELTKDEFINKDKKELHMFFRDIIKLRVKDQSFLDMMPNSLKLVGSVLQKLSKKDKSKLLTRLDNYVFL